MMIFLREKFIAQIFMWVIAVVFVLVSVMVGPQLFSGSSGQGGVGTQGEVVLRIDGTKISRSYFEALVARQMQSRQNQRFGGPPDRKEIEKQIIQGLVERAIEGSAEISDAEVEYYIRSDENRVQQYNQYGPDIANTYKEILSATTLRDSIQNLELVTDTEVEQAYNLEADKAKVKYIEFQHSDYVSTVNVDDAEAETFFQENIDNYRTEEQVNVKYIEIKPVDFVTQHDVVTYYSENESEFRIGDVVRARHILKKFPTDDATDEQKAETKAAAEELLKTVNAGLAAGTSFADLAKEHSEGPSSVDGGALGVTKTGLPPGKYFGRGEMAKPFEEACFDTLEAGEVSELVETRFGYHIINLEEKITATLKPFTEVEGEIRDKLIQINGVEGAKEVAQNLLFDIEKEDYETAITLDLYKDLSLSVAETGFFAKDAVSIPKIGSQFTYGGLVKELFDMEVGVTNTIETKNYSGDVSAYFVATVLGKKPPMIPKFEDVKDKVITGTDGLRNQKTKASAFAAAQELINQYSENESLDDLIKKYKAPEGSNASDKTVEESGDFNLDKRSFYVSNMGSSRDVMLAAFQMAVGEVRGPFQGDSAVYIIELTERVEPDTDPSEKTKQFQTLLGKKKRDVYQTWLAARKKAANVWIHEDYR